MQINCPLKNGLVDFHYPSNKIPSRPKIVFDCKDCDVKIKITASCYIARDRKITQHLHVQEFEGKEAAIAREKKISKYFIFIDEDNRDFSSITFV